ncbi:glycosyltransferase [Roseiconus nitratireducens]|uniref:Glycosyltransferase n=1 Tax=Roseiconus nitratireducens TaxID=2605748 RepID=A0A5M6D8Z0_9BACT|nr:glycosyltransferase [Roseiconus nitratireducens]KAA5543823.1 glycosyltransferase [Roseiconus nitratireducens]
MTDTSATNCMDPSAVASTVRCERESQVDVSIVIPTLGRERVLVETLQSLLRLASAADELLVIDQSAAHDAETDERLSAWHASGSIRWIRLTPPSITRAMNHGLRQARSPLVLFLDDDIRPHPNLVASHRRAHCQSRQLWATVGQVIQPWQRAECLDPPRKRTGLRLDEDFPFHSTREMPVHNVMAGNLCVNRDRALALGGFDEQFQGAAFRFETEFARRLEKAGGEIRFLGDAGIDHLRVAKGGTRTAGSHLTSASPLHGVGDHYYAMLHAATRSEARSYCFRRIVREVRTRFHLTHPWWIPVKLVGEIRAYRLAKLLVRNRFSGDARIPDRILSGTAKLDHAPEHPLQTLGGNGCQ